MRLLLAVTGFVVGVLLNYGYLAGQNMIWTREQTQGSDAYKNTWSLGNCQVSTRAEGGLVLSAKEEFGSLIYKTEIEIDSAGRATTRNAVSREQMSGMKLKPAWNIFARHCLDASRNLPPEIRTQFHGNFGIH